MTQTYYMKRYTFKAHMEGEDGNVMVVSEWGTIGSNARLEITSEMPEIKRLTPIEVSRN